MQAAGLVQTPCLVAGPVNAATAGSQLSTARAQLRDISDVAVEMGCRGQTLDVARGVRSSALLAAQLEGQRHFHLFCIVCALAEALLNLPLRPEQPTRRALARWAPAPTHARPRRL